jgi:cephalosporin hydroxylase
MPALLRSDDGSLRSQNADHDQLGTLVTFIGIRGLSDEMKTMIQKMKREIAHLRDVLYYRLTFDSSSEQAVMDQFHKLYFDSHVFGKAWMGSSWMGVRIHKCPTDLWTYQEIIYEVEPDVIVETGTLLGGSAYYLASLCDLIGRGRVITIDVDSAEDSISRERGPVCKVRPNHPRITYLRGSSTSEDVLLRVKSLIHTGDRVLVVLDSDHSKGHVFEELCAYSPLVSMGSYLIVEDTNVNGHPILPQFGPGPMEAVEEFLAMNTNFVLDRSREKHLLTFNPNGYLRRKSEDTLKE